VFFPGFRFLASELDLLDGLSPRNEGARGFTDRISALRVHYDATWDCLSAQVRSSDKLPNGRELLTFPPKSISRPVGEVFHQGLTTPSPIIAEGRSVD